MINRMIVSGFGGQGVLLTGQLLGIAANDSDKYAIFLPHYGPEQRGGTANCEIVLSDTMIDSPVTENVDALMAFNNPSICKFQHRVRENGVIFVNSNQCDVEAVRKNLDVYAIPADEIADEIGSRKVSNIVMLGAYAGISPVISKEEILHAVQSKLGRKPELMLMNLNAFEKGYNCVIEANKNKRFRCI